MASLEWPIIDLHVHLRDEPKKHLEILNSSGYSEVLAMANTNEALDSLDKLETYRNKCSGSPLKVNLVSAITKDSAGNELVEINKIKSRVAGFSDDGRCLTNLDLLASAFSEDISIFAHLEPEEEMLEKYINILKQVDRGRLHCQHISRSGSVKILRKAKADGLPVTAETCPHYLYLSSELDDLVVNPPLGEENDRVALIRGLQDGTIDCLASDYAPLPRKTGFAGARMFVPLCFGLVLNGTITEQQLKDKLYLNPKTILTG